MCFPRPPQHLRALISRSLAGRVSNQSWMHKKQGCLGGPNLIVSCSPLIAAPSPSNSMTIFSNKLYININDPPHCLPRQSLKRTTIALPTSVLASLVEADSNRYGTSKITAYRCIRAGLDTPPLFLALPGERRLLPSTSGFFKDIGVLNKYVVPAWGTRLQSISRSNPNQDDAEPANPVEPFRGADESNARPPQP